MIIPENQGLFADRGPFINVLPDGRRYATLGAAGPWRLKSDVNRSTDVDLSTKVEYEAVDVGAQCEDDVIIKLFATDAGYRDSLLYEILPSIGFGYNSNSYAAGLLQASGLPVPKIKKNVPGYKKPVPAKKFQQPSLSTEEERLRALGLKRGKNGIEPANN